MTLDPELKAMNEVYVALENLEEEARKRVIEWATGRFSLKVAKGLGGIVKNTVISGGNYGEALASFESVADIFAKANPKNDADKALVVASYLQEKNAGSDLTSRAINKELQHLGHGVGNITNTISVLMNRDPKLMIQTRKDGTTKQAQKKYRVTAEGISFAKKMLATPESDEA